MVGVLGFEPRTSSLSGTRSNQLSYTPLTSPKSCHPSLTAERRPRDVSPRSLARLNQSSGSFSGIPCGFAVLMPARMDDVCQNRLVPNCPAHYFLIFRSRWTTDLPLVEPKGLEPSTSCLQSRCSSQLSYGPLKLY